VCGYIDTLLPGGPFEHLADLAAEQVKIPLPHRGGCPCVLCYSARLGSWNVDCAGLTRRDLTDLDRLERFDTRFWLSNEEYDDRSSA